ncbi:MAG: lytic transglycosylase domain-containing protein [Reyranella sp.]|nr:lytic transglycosylase domain-containing protein [Reyranella sp.]
MRAESGGEARAVGKGTMGRVQVIPWTWVELQLRYDLGADPYHPHDCIAAGTVYLRAMHDRCGEAGLLGVYNAGHVVTKACRHSPIATSRSSLLHGRCRFADW